MYDGFIKAAAITPQIRVADPVFNSEQIMISMREAAAEGAKILVFPELAITGYTCGDLFLPYLRHRRRKSRGRCGLP